MGTDSAIASTTKEIAEESRKSSAADLPYDIFNTGIFGIGSYMRISSELTRGHVLFKTREMFSKTLVLCNLSVIVYSANVIPVTKSTPEV